MKKEFWFFVLSLCIMASSFSEGWAQPNLLVKPPILTNSYAIQRGRYGDVLKIYIEADDPEGEMLRIATSVEQVGFGHYATDWVYLKPQYQHHFIGYLEWNTFSSKTSRLREWTQITIKVSVFDKAGNESNVAVFPFEFVSQALSNPKPPAPFDKTIPRLGYININLVEPTFREREQRH